jgi:hypothetical protein
MLLNYSAVVHRTPQHINQLMPRLGQYNISDKQQHLPTAAGSPPPLTSPPLPPAAADVVNRAAVQVAVSSLKEVHPEQLVCRLVLLPQLPPAPAATAQHRWQQPLSLLLVLPGWLPWLLLRETCEPGTSGLDRS